MAAYGALVSVMQIIDQLQHHPRPPIFLYEKLQIEPLTEKITFLQDFLEVHSHVNSKEVHDLESRIAAAAYAAEDVIESHIVDQILARSTSDLGQKITSFDFYCNLSDVIKEMDVIKKEAMEIKENMGVQVQDQLHRSSTISSAGSSTSASTSTGWKKTEMVGFDDLFIEMMDKILGGQPDRQIIPIVGMGGSGKTTLAQNIYEHKRVVKYFDIRTRVTVSQKYRMREILVKFLPKDGDTLSEVELKNSVHKKLWGRRYLIILDDVWDIEVWDDLKHFFPDNKNGSRIMVTTRLSNLAPQLTPSPGIKMKFLDDNKSWDLFSKIVFGKEECPPILKEIGNTIVKKCKGLPLSIVVIGGLLAKSEKKREYWEHIVENLNSTVNLEENEYCLKLLYTSYNNLPVHLKPCFLYMGVFGEDDEIDASNLTKLWVAEGFLKPIGGKSLEDAGEEYLKELVERNLILAHEYTFRGRIKYCQIHDILRDLCLREAQKHKFLCVSINPKDINIERRIWIHESTSDQEYNAEMLDALETPSLVRSLSWKFQEPSPSFNFKLLRVSCTIYENDERGSSLEPIFQQVNLRCIFVSPTLSTLPGFMSSISLFWNLQTVNLSFSRVEVISGPSEIWAMPLLRHVLIPALELPDPPTRDGQDDIVLKNLHSLIGICNFKYDQEVVKRIPNIKKLKVGYTEIDDVEESPPNYYLNNLGHLHKLETLDFMSDMPLFDFGQNITFPHSLKKLTLIGTQLEWEDLNSKISSLSLLEVLKLEWRSCRGSHWKTVKGQFCSLRLLQIDCCDGLEYWTTDSTHFPRLERLVVEYLKVLKEIPLCIGDIPTLQSIKLVSCSDSASDSAERIIEEQEYFGNEHLKVEVYRSDW